MDSNMAQKLARALEIDKKYPSALLSYDVPIPAYEFICMHLIVQIAQEMEVGSNDFIKFPLKLARTLNGEERNKDYRRLNQAIDFLDEQKIRWNVAKEDKTIDSFSARFIVTKKTNSEDKNPEFKVNRDILDLIRDTKVFAPMNLLMLAVFSHMRPAYPFYVYIKDAQVRGATELYIPLKQLKILFNVEEHEYENAFKHFNQVHIKPKCGFIRSQSDITFEYGNVREGRRVVGIRLTDIREQQWQQVLFNKEHDEQDALINDIISLALDLQQAFKSDDTKSVSDQYLRKMLTDDTLGDAFLQVYARFKRYNISKQRLQALMDEPSVGIEGLHEIITQCEKDIKRREKSSNPVKSPVKHVQWAITKGWKDEGYGLKALDIRRKEAKEWDVLREKRQDERDLFFVGLSFKIAEREHQSQLDSLHNHLLTKARKNDVLKQKFRNSLTYEWDISAFENYGWEAKILRTKLIGFLAAEFEQSIPSLEDICASYDIAIKNGEKAIKRLDTGVHREVFERSLSECTKENLTAVLDKYLPALPESRAELS